MICEFQSNGLSFKKSGKGIFIQTIKEVDSMSVYDQISSCCSRIEEADTKEDVLREVDKLDQYASYLNADKAKRLHIYCDNIRKLNVDVKSETVNQSQSIRKLFS
jgi:hypothetical protein